MPNASCRTSFIVANIHEPGTAADWRENGHRTVLGGAGRQRDSVRGSASSPGRKGADGKPETRHGSPAPTPSPISGPAQLRDRAARRASSASPTTSKPRKASAGSPSTRWRISAPPTWASRSPVRPCARRCATVPEGRDPQNIFRDAVKNRALETSCWNTVMTSGAVRAELKPGNPLRWPREGQSRARDIVFQPGLGCSSLTPAAYLRQSRSVRLSRGHLRRAAVAGC